MSVLAPLRVPVELRRSGASDGRWFRLAHGVSEGGLLFPRGLPLELEGPVDVSFFLPLPDEAEPITCAGRVIEMEPEPDEVEIEGAALRRAVRFVGLDSALRARIARYVEERVPQ